MDIHKNGAWDSNRGKISVITTVYSWRLTIERKNIRKDYHGIELGNISSSCSAYLGGIGYAGSTSV